MKKQQKTIIILLTCSIAVVLYLLSIRLAYPVFQNTRLMDPLAEVHILFPLYYIAIALIALAGFTCFAWRINNKSLNILVLLLLGIMLWYTPYYMAEFSRNPDVARDIGIALYAPGILSGDAVVLSGYCANYPSSYLLTWLFIHTTGIEPLEYVHLFPLLYIGIFIILGYAFISRLFNQRVAFLAMLITIPGLHYAIFYASAHSIGVLLTMTTLVLLFRKGAVFKALTVVAITATIICHPISPLIVSIFIAAALLTSYRGSIGRTQLFLTVMLVLCFVGWFIWPAAPLVSTTAIEATPEKMGLSGDTGTQAEMMYQRVTPETLDTTRQYLSGKPFIYGGIHKLNLFVYFLYALLAAAGIMYIVTVEYYRRKSIRHFLLRFGGLNRNQLFLILSGVLLFVLTILLAESDHVLLERSLTFLILVLSCLIASVIVELYYSGVLVKLLSAIVVGAVLFLTLSFPVVTYSIEAYTNFPASEKVALEFIADDVLVEQKTISTSFSGQLLLFTFNFIRQPMSEEDISEGTEVIAFRSTGYYYTAMRHELSFEDNSFTRYREAVADYTGYDKVYLNPTTEIFIRADD